MYGDESRFCMISNIPTSVARREGEGYLPECLSSTFELSGDGIMVWSCTLCKRIDIVYNISGTATREHYAKI